METSFGTTIRQLRQKNDLLLRELAAKLEIDTSLLSKIESNNRIANKDLIQKLSNILGEEYNYLLKIWFSDKISNLLKDEENIDDILRMAKQKLRNGK